MLILMKGIVNYLSPTNKLILRIGNITSDSNHSNRNSANVATEIKMWNWN